MNIQNVQTGDQIAQIALTLTEAIAKFMVHLKMDTKKKHIACPVQIVQDVRISNSLPFYKLKLSVYGNLSKDESVKLSKYDLCKKCRKIHPILGDGKPSNTSIEDILDGEDYNAPNLSFIMTNDEILFYLEDNGGCSSCINLLKRTNDSLMYPPDILNALRKKANSGDIEAILNLYSKLNISYGFEKNEIYSTEANQWIEKAAKLGNAYAQFELACMYKDDKNDESNYLKWLKKSAKNGYTKAKHNLAVMYLIKGQTKQAFSWMEQASKEGHAMATWKLAKFYFDGTGVSIDKEKAISLLHKAADMGDETAREMIANIYKQ